MNILITGATGFLGGATTVSLLRAGFHDQLRFLVRADCEQDGLVRLKDSLRRFDVDEADLDRILMSQIIPGDLAAVHRFERDPRLEDITHVCNCAAVASFGNHPQIWPVNVDGTVAFAKRMAVVRGLKRFLHVGTAMACGPHKEDLIEESWDTPPKDKHLVLYTASKAEAERQIRETVPQLPFVVARPSIVVGHTTLGCKPSTSIFWVFRMAHEIEQFMCELDQPIDVIPADYCAHALHELLLRKTLSHSLYHISAGTGGVCNIREIDVALAKARGIAPVGDRYKKISLNDLPKLLPIFQERLKIENRKLLMKAVMLYGAFSSLHYVFDNRRLLAEGISPPPRLTDYIGQCVRTTENMPLLEQMNDDFK